MLNTFKYVVLTLMRTKAVLIWALAFPIVLSCCFIMMFQGLDSVGGDKPVRTVIVDDDAYANAPELRSFMEQVSEGDDALLAATFVESEQEAAALLDEKRTGDDAFAGYVTADADGMPVVHVLDGARTSTADMEDVYQSILVMVADAFTSRFATVENLLVEAPAAFADENVRASIGENIAATAKVDVTQNAPKESVRYYFALLGMASLFGANASLIAVALLLPNVSALGARRALGGVSRTRSLAATIGAAWTVSYVCLAVAFLFIRFVAGVDFGGRDAQCLVALAVCSLMATALGAFVGTLPKLSVGAKSGLLTGITCFATLFAGLYGQPTMELADRVLQACPASEFVNPAVQVSQALYSIMYYDSLAPYLGHLAVLAAMALLFFAGAARVLGRKRYESI